MPKRVLVVDADPAIRRLTRRALNRAECEVIEAGHADAAARLLDVHGGQFQLLIVDIGLPGVSGLDLANYVDVAHPGQKILYVSGLIRSVAVESIGMRNPLLVLKKPFTPKQLLKRVRLLAEL